MVEMHEMVPGKRFDRYHELGQEKTSIWLSRLLGLLQLWQRLLLPLLPLLDRDFRFDPLLPLSSPQLQLHLRPLPCRCRHVLNLLHHSLDGFPEKGGTRAPSPSAASFATTPSTATATTTDDYSYLVCTFYQKGVCSYGSRCRYEHELAWHSSSPTFGMDVNSTLRACPICRKVSYFVIPSVIWYSTKEEKKRKLLTATKQNSESGQHIFLDIQLAIW